MRLARYALSVLVLIPLLWLGNPALALLAAAGLSLAFERPPLPNAGRLGSLALQAAVVLLGLRMDAGYMLALGGEHALAISIHVLLTLGFGLLLGALMRSPTAGSKLVASGTAICGGTAVATLSPLLRASAAQTGVVLTLIFLLNALALLLLPWVGRQLAMSETAFGLWVAMAVHDTASVVAVATLYGEDAAEVATTLKLGRTLWLVPLALLFSLANGGRHGGGLQFPFFILLFIGAALLGSQLALPASVMQLAGLASKTLLVLALFCIGGGISRATLRHLRGREVLQGLLLWLAVLPLTFLAAVRLA